MNLSELGLATIGRPRLLHALPGRLRLHAPFLKRYGKEFPELVEMAARLLTLPEEIEEVSPNPISGNVLLRYDPDKISQEDVVAFFRAVLRCCVRDRDLLARVLNERPDTVEQELCDWMRAALSRRLYLDPGVRIQDYVRD